MGPVIAKYTEQVFISNQTLMVKINNSALRAELSMMRTQIVRLLNDHIGVMVIADVKLY
jgi:predicted nucleic acid-binding Zn ribbon protein